MHPDSDVPHNPKASNKALDNNPTNIRKMILNYI
jgi:hypothetical protein